MQKIYPAKIFSIYHERPIQKIWEMDKDTYDRIITLHDDVGNYLWSPDLEYPAKAGYLIGEEIQIAEQTGIRLVYAYRKTKNTKLVIVE